MEIKFNQDNNSVEIVFKNQQQKILFDLTKEVKLTDFVKLVSDFDNKILINPESFDYFMVDKEPSNKESYKLIEYLYKIVESFNESYQTVYGSETLNSQDKSSESG